MRFSSSSLLDCKFIIIITRTGECWCNPHQTGPPIPLFERSPGYSLLPLEFAHVPSTVTHTSEYSCEFRSPALD